MNGEAVAGAVIADTVATAYGDYRERFEAITARAPDRFLRQDWAGVRRDARERILLYDRVVREALDELRARLGRAPDRDAAIVARSAYAAWAAGSADEEIAHTFYNSVVRRLVGVQGTDPELEFLRIEERPPPGDAADPGSGAAPTRVESTADGWAPALDRVLGGLGLDAPWADREARIRRAAALLEREVGPASRVGALEVLRPLFFRNKGAYVVARRRAGDGWAPLLLALVGGEAGVALDAVLPTSDEASVVFGFTRSYLHVRTDAPRPLIGFLRSIMPHKRIDELYTAIGFNRHGKTELYRALELALGRDDARFEPAEGTPGLVMIVFTLPSLNVVFKVIRDRFGAPKRVSRERVLENYELIFTHDRVGRLADAQSFEHLALPRRCFSPALLEELARDAARTVRVDGDRVRIAHLYVERRVRPLDLYFHEADDARARHAALDYGAAIKELAAANLFPGDMLVKNFGVTRHERVIFYDYDEVALLTSCVFREPPPAPYPEAELAAEPHYHVGPDDVFPHEWRGLLGPPAPWREAFLQAHPEIFDVAWWRDMQERQRAGEMVDFYPYGEERRV